MSRYRLDPSEITTAFPRHLADEERSPGTIQNYVRHVLAFACWLDGEDAQEDSAARWKRHLQDLGYAPASINAMLAAVNKYFQLAGRQEYQTKPLRIQRRAFRDTSRELTREEYRSLVSAAAAQRQDRLALLLETICATGIRVSEVRYITVEAAQSGQTDILLKGKVRTILLPQPLCRKLLDYALARGVSAGPLFLTRSGTLLSRRQIWAEMKALGKKAGIPEDKVYPHNLRHLFARTYYTATRDVAQLADILGHSNIETTRIYLISTGAEHAQQLERLGLIG